MEARLSIISLGVRDLEKARIFYQEGLGFPVAGTSTSEIVFFKTHGVRLALYPVDKLAEDIGIDFKEYKPGFKGITIAHNTRRKEEVDEILRAAQDTGGKILKPAADTFWGGYSGCFLIPMLIFGKLHTPTSGSLTLWETLCWIHNYC